jgi:hypothetical protein
MARGANLATTEMSPYQLQSKRIREKLKGLSATDKLKAWYGSEDPFELNEMENRLRERWEEARRLFLDNKMYSEIVDELVAAFGISPQLAKIDIRNMRHTFGDTDEISKQAHRQRAINMALQAYRKAEKDGDVGQMIKAAKQYALVSGALDPDQGTMDVQKLMNDRTYVEVLDPGVRDLFLALIGQFGGVVDSSKVVEAIMAAKGSEYTEHEEVK